MNSRHTGLLSPNMAATEVDLKPDAVAEREQNNCSILNLPCQVGKPYCVENAFSYFGKVILFNYSNIIFSYAV